MKALYIALVVAFVAVVRIALYRSRRRRRAAADSPQLPAGHDSVLRPPVHTERQVRGWRSPDRFGEVGAIAAREIKERVRGRIFRVGTLVLLVVVALAIIIPKLTSGGGATAQTVGVVGELSPQVKQVVDISASLNEDQAHFVPEPSLAAAMAGLRGGTLDVAVVNGDEILLNAPAGSKKSSADPSFVLDLAQYLGVLKAYRIADLTPNQAALVSRAKPVPVRSLQSGATSTTKPVSVVGLVLLFIMLTQYCTWILIGVMQEKSSRVVEVLLATVRPIQLLGGKVLGIGLVALGQAAVVVGFALAVAGAAGSDLVHGTAPVVLLCELLWLVLGYAFYCWMYAAAGSMAERQDQVQTLALPLSIPILVGYVFSITVASSGSPDLFFKVLAYLPPTAPFCMSVLVALDQVVWWQVLGSVLISIVGTVAMAILAARIYRRAVLRTGARVRVGELFVRTLHP